jgi:hypothetical protein
MVDLLLFSGYSLCCLGLVWEHLIVYELPKKLPDKAFSLSFVSPA